MTSKAYRCDKSSCALNNSPILQDDASRKYKITGEGPCPKDCPGPGGGRLTLVEVLDAEVKGRSVRKRVFVGLSATIISTALILFLNSTSDFFETPEKDQGVAVEPTNPKNQPSDDYSNLIAKGVAASRTDNFKAAVDAYREAIKADPYRIEAFVNLSAVFLKLGKYEDAERSIREAIEIASKDPRLHYQLAVILALKGEKSKSLLALDLSLQLGLPDPRIIMEDYDLKGLRDSVEFKNLMKKHNIVP